MNIRRYASAVAVLGVSFSTALVGQISSGGMGTGNAIASGPAQPYTATVKTTTVQKLANGTTITHESIRTLAHDSAGREYSETHFDAAATRDGQKEDRYSVNINDPTNRTNTRWNYSTKIVAIEHMPERSSQMRPVAAHNTAAAQPQIETHTEQLGAKTIAGLAATGFRTMRTIPAGAEGNDQPLIITEEHWHATDLRLELFSIRDDPRTGITTTEVTAVERGEPDPALFQIPEGYTVKEHYPDQQQ